MSEYDKQISAIREERDQDEKITKINEERERLLSLLSKINNEKKKYIDEAKQIQDDVEDVKNKLVANEQEEKKYKESYLSKSRKFIQDILKFSTQSTDAKFSRLSGFGMRVMNFFGGYERRAQKLLTDFDLSKDFSSSLSNALAKIKGKPRFAISKKIAQLRKKEFLNRILVKIKADFEKYQNEDGKDLSEKIENLQIYIKRIRSIKEKYDNHNYKHLLGNAAPIDDNNDFINSCLEKAGPQSPDVPNHMEIEETTTFNEATKLFETKKAKVIR